MDKVKALPVMRNNKDEVAFEEIVRALKAVVGLFQTHQLDQSFESAIYINIYEKISYDLSRDFTRSLRKTPPKLAKYLAHLEDELFAMKNTTAYKKSLITVDQQMQALHISNNNSYNRPTSFRSQTFTRTASRSMRPPPNQYRPGFSNQTRPRSSTTTNRSPATGYRASNSRSFAKRGTFRGGRGKVTTTRIASGVTQGRAMSVQHKKVEQFCQQCNTNTHSELFCPTTPQSERIKHAIRMKVCLSCLQSGHFADKCPTGRPCGKCRGRHAAFICPNPDKPSGPVVSSANSVLEQSAIVSEEDPLGSCLRQIFDQHEDLVYNVTQEVMGKTNIPVPFRIGEITLEGLVDTGATVNLLPAGLAESLKVKTYASEHLLHTPQGSFTTKYATLVTLELGCYQKQVEFLINTNRDTIILGTPVFTSFKLIIDYHLRILQHNIEENTFGLLNRSSATIIKPNSTEAMEISQLDGLKKLVLENKELFAESGNEVGKITTEKCHIRLTLDVPITIRPYRCSTSEQENIDAQVQELLDKGIIRPSVSAYSFPVVMVKRRGEEVKTRLCVNYIKLNNITISEYFVMPKIEDIRDLFLGARIFSVLDLSCGFYHIEIEESDKGKTAFSTNSGHYEFNRMPFGLKNAPILFQRVIQNLLTKHLLNRFCVNYLDDIVCFSPSFDKHLEHLQKLFAMVRAENIKLKLKKCQFGKSSVKYLGYMISQDQVSPLVDNVKAIREAKAPEDVRSLRGFLGSVNYYQRFIPNRAILLYALYQLLRKNAEWIWDEEAQKAFEEVKLILTSDPILRIFNPAFETILYTDASRKGVGAVLKQVDTQDPTKLQHAVGYFSKSLLDYQKNYSVSELELLSMILACENWSYYLVGITFTIITDHRPLQAINNLGLSKPNTRLFNWSLRLKQYDFKIKYISGKLNEEADWLSRHPVEQLKKLTEDSVMWIEEEQIQEAQKTVTDIPKNVRRDQKTNKLVYVKADEQKLYLPNEFVKQEMEKLHHRRGHLGFKQMELQFVRKYYNPELHTLLKQMLNDCDVCMQVRRQTQQYGLLGQILAEAPFQVIHIDTKSGFKNLGSQKDNLHVAIDSFSRFIWVTTSRSKLGIDFINLINQIITIEKPKMIVADNYPAIKGREFQNYLKNKQISMVFTAANHPSSNGMVERAHQTLLNNLRCMKLTKPQLAWTTLVREVVDNYNHSVHSSTEYTPHYLITGNDEDKLFIDETLEESRKKAFARSQQRHIYSANRHNETRIDPEIETGDQVFVQAKHSLNRRLLEPTYNGPYEVVEKIGNSSYGIDNNGKTEQYHVSQLKTRKRTRSLDSASPPSSPVRNGTVFAVSTVSLGKETNIKVPFMIGPVELVGLVDTGASVNLIPEKLVQRLHLEEYEAKHRLFTPNGEFRTRNATVLVMKIGGYEALVEFLVYDHRDTIILGLPIFTGFKLNLDYELTISQYDQQTDTYLPLRTTASPIVDVSLIEEWIVESSTSWTGYVGDPYRMLNRHSTLPWLSSIMLPSSEAARVSSEPWSDEEDQNEEEDPSDEEEYEPN